ncbi:hypothetical protein [Lentilactobacillus sp. Marseille-Q4993]|uniref:hypothetical protein n=1 Tax=Lentilactobacillus sp. Marseille-Q4993 TaxID=3039492 RepID=UPI0024BCEB60|nr:hypothetical protein [Lentilactobacillus sp. Marseille-Q4993]
MDDKPNDYLYGRLFPHSMPEAIIAKYARDELEKRARWGDEEAEYLLNKRNYGKCIIKILFRNKK